MHDPRLQQLLDEMLDSHATPEEVCEGCPEMLGEVRERWRQMCRVRAELDALFPPSFAAKARPQRIFWTPADQGNGKACFFAPFRDTRGGPLTAERDPSFSGFPTFP